MTAHTLSPVRSSERYVILDALRGFALLGICMANFPEFSLFTFLKPEAAAALPTAAIDRFVRYLTYVFVDGKFYTLFSLLFGIGFSLIITHAMQKGADGFRIFYRRMTVLAVIGFLHLMFIWSGDILMLYALLGLLLPCFRHVSDRGLLTWAAVLLIVPVFIDLACEVAEFYPARRVVELQAYYCAKYGITEENFAYWLRDINDYEGMFQFLIQGALVRVQEFMDGNRYFKVLGLFLIGFYIGRKHMYADLESRRLWLKHVCRAGMLAGLPLSLVYAWSCMNAHPLGLTAHSVLYLLSVYPLGFAYMAGLCLLYLKSKNGWFWKWLAAPGRMALTNYIGQSVIGVCLFYGIGLGWGADIGATYTEGIVLAVYVLQVVFSRLWLSAFRFGPLEWGWRMLTYGKWFRLRNEG